MALTKAGIDRLEYDPEGPKLQIEIDGAEIPGFGVRVHPSGRKTFTLTYRTRGRPTPRRIVLGTYGTLTLDEARQLARQTLMQAKTGGDPLEARRKQRIGDSVRDLAAVYIERHARPRKKTWREDERRIERHILPAFGRRKIADVRRADVARLHGTIGTTAPYEANRVLALLAVMFNKAAEWGLVEEGAPNPAGRIQTFKERSRDRWVTPAELPRLVEAIDAETSPYIRAAFKLYLLTGLRRSELLGLRWKDVDFARCELRLEDTKNGRAHVVPLSTAAMEIVRELPRGIGSAHLFPGSVPGKPMANVTRAWERIRQRAGLPDVRLHDLRRTVGSWLATGGASLPLIGKVLNHSNVATTAVYARLAEDAGRTALEEHGALLGPLLRGGGEP